MKHSTAPLEPLQQQQVVAATQRHIAHAGAVLDRRFDAVTIRFDLKGMAAGMYWHKQGMRVIRYNPWLFAKYFEDNLVNTVPHEVAHYLCDVLYGLRTIRPHGLQWRAIMQLFDAAPVVRHQYDLHGVPQRVVRRFPYRCDCRQYQLSSIRHRRIATGTGYYQCRQCGTKLAPAFSPHPLPAGEGMS
jgi:SprT protein